MNWLLPESIEDVLPHEAQQLEALRRTLLDEFRLYGYELVMPPLLEYLESLLTGSGQDMDLRIFKLVDQSSGRTMGIRADTTPQVARIDAHLLNRQGVTRLCYCGSILHTLPSSLTATREPLQIGAEIYGHAGLEADIEIIRLLARGLALAGVQVSCLNLGHIGIFHALIADTGLNITLKQALFSALQSKDASALRELTLTIPEPVRSAFLALPDCYGGLKVLTAAARVLPKNAEIAGALDELEHLHHALADFPVSFDLSDLRGYHYHTGVVFAAYSEGSASAIALGGRYDKVGEAFGRGRPATGFSMDLRELAPLSGIASSTSRILVPWVENKEQPQLQQAIAELRAQGRVLIETLPGHEGTWVDAGCSHRLVKQNGYWVVVDIE